MLLDLLYCKNVEQFSYPKKLDQFTNHNSAPLFSFVVQNKPFIASCAHSNAPGKAGSVQWHESTQGNSWQRQKGNLEIQRQREGLVKSIRGVAGDQKLQEKWVMQSNMRGRTFRIKQEEPSLSEPHENEVEEPSPN